MVAYRRTEMIDSSSETALWKFGVTHGAPSLPKANMAWASAADRDELRERSGRHDARNISRSPRAR